MFEASWTRLFLIFFQLKHKTWVSGSRTVTTKMGHFFMVLCVPDIRVLRTRYRFHHYLALRSQLLFDHLCNMENNKMKIDVYNIFLFTKNYEHLRLPPPISLFYTIMRFQYLRSNSSQMSTFKLQHFFMNDVPAYFGNAGI